MSRLILGMMLALGLSLTACESVLAQEHRGWPEEGSLHWSATPQAAQNAAEGSSAGSTEHRRWRPGRALHWTPSQQPAPSENANVGSGEHRGWPPEGALNWSQEQSFSANPRAAAPDWRYVFHDGRWWYWMPNSSWMYWDHGGWQNFAAAGVSR